MNKVRKINEPTGDEVDALLFLANDSPVASPQHVMTGNDEESSGASADSVEPLRPRHKKRKSVDYCDDLEEPMSGASRSPSSTSRSNSFAAPSSIALQTQILSLVEENKKLKIELADLKLQLTPSNIFESTQLSREVQRLAAAETEALRREIAQLRAEMRTANTTNATANLATIAIKEQEPTSSSSSSSLPTTPVGVGFMPPVSRPIGLPVNGVLPTATPNSALPQYGYVQFNGTCASLNQISQPAIMIEAILKECNKLSMMDRQMITEFVLGNKTHWDVSKGQMQSIVMNEELVTVANEEHCERILFEANVVTGSWTKIKRRGRLIRHQHPR